MTRIRDIVVVAFVLMLMAAPMPAQESYPTRPLTIVVPFPPGGVADLTARPLAPALERVLKQPVVVVNKQGAAGAVGMQSVAIAKPDGYTLMVALVSVSTIPEVDALLGRTPAYTRDQLVGIARLNADPPVLVVGAEQPWKSLKELIEDARPLGTFGAARLAALPEVPTLKELGYDVEYYLWAALFAPRGLPPAVFATLRDATRRAVQDPQFRSAMDKVETPIAYQDADEFRAWWDADARRLAAVIKQIGRVEPK